MPSLPTVNTVHKHQQSPSKDTTSNKLLETPFHEKRRCNSFLNYPCWKWLKIESWEAIKSEHDFWDQNWHFPLIKNRSSIWENRSTILRWCRKNISYFWTWFCSFLWGILSTININLVSNEYCVENGLEANIQTRVYREFLLATTVGLGLFWFTLNKTLLGLSLLVTERCWDLSRIRFFRLILVTQYLFVKKLISL